MVRWTLPAAAEHTDASRLVTHGSSPAPRFSWSLCSDLNTGRLLLIATLLLVAVQPVFAQRLLERVRISVSGGGQIDSTRLSESISLTKYVEPTPVEAEAKGVLPFVDFGVALPLAGNLGAGVSVSYLTNRGEAEVTAQIPHPFYFDRPRPISGPVSGVRHKELATHINLVYFVPSPDIDLMFSGGASFFQVEQSLVSDIIYAETYPYDTASFVDATLTTARESKLGYNVGADVTWKLSPQWGLGGLFRFSRARVPFTVGALDAGTVTVGGVQAGVGLRLTIQRRSPGRPTPPRRP
jgi:hypothetical protein